MAPAVVRSERLGCIFLILVSAPVSSDSPAASEHRLSDLFGDVQVARDSEYDSLNAGMKIR